MAKVSPEGEVSGGTQGHHYFLFKGEPGKKKKKGVEKEAHHDTGGGLRIRQSEKRKKGEKVKGKEKGKGRT